MSKNPKMKEKLGVYDNNKVVSFKGEGRHVSKHFKIISDRSAGKKRFIVLEEMDRTEIETKKKELLEAILINMGDEKNKTVRALITDVLNDYTDESVTDLHDRVVVKKQKVQAKEGCFKLVIGDGRSKKRKEIMIRD